MSRHVLALIFLAALVAAVPAAAQDTRAEVNVGAGHAAPPAGQAPSTPLPKGKQTTLGLYVTAKEAFDTWKADPDSVKILDVRTTEEYVFVGHPAMAWNVPFELQTYEWDTRKRLPMKPNPDFLAQAKAIAKPGETLLVMCRSGSRSALAVNALAEAGFMRAYNITDGMEGDAVEDPGSVFVGQHLRNGWKNSGVPWTYELAPGRMTLPKVR
jgi:rhodanese-related sulfurtransferase